MDFHAFRELLLSLEDRAAREGEPACLQALEAALQELTAQRKLLSAEEDWREMTRFRELLHPLILQSDFCARVFLKPRGHAGDYVGQEDVWFGRTVGGTYRYCGQTPLGKLLSSLTLDMANCIGNEERIWTLQAKINGTGKRLASIGCGSCIEYWGQEGMADCDVLFLDQDADALAHARSKINGSVGRATFECQNVLKFILRRDAASVFGNRDFVYASGLFDYFEQGSARRLAAGLWSLVAPGGSLLIINEHPDNPTRLWMEYGGDWFLTYKTEAQMRELAEGLADVASVSLTLDQQGVYQYLEVRKA